MHSINANLEGRFLVYEVQMSANAAALHLLAFVD